MPVIEYNSVICNSPSFLLFLSPCLVRIYSFFVVTLLFGSVVAVLLMRLFALVHTKATRRESNPEWLVQNSRFCCVQKFE